MKRGYTLLIKGLMAVLMIACFPLVILGFFYEEIFE